MSTNGAVGDAFFHESDVFVGSDAAGLTAKGFELTPARGLFICALLRAEKYRYDYGRKLRLEVLKSTQLVLPIKADGQPDWPAIDAYMSGLPWSTGALG